MNGYDDATRQANTYHPGGMFTRILCYASMIPTFKDIQRTKGGLRVKLAQKYAVQSAVLRRCMFRRDKAYLCLLRQLSPNPMSCWSRREVT
jgi:hypothetical protein